MTGVVVGRLFWEVFFMSPSELLLPDTQTFFDAQMEPERQATFPKIGVNV